MIEQKCNLNGPKAPPHYEQLSHPLVHSSNPPSYLSCLDSLHNAACLLTLFRHLNLKGDSDSGELSTDAAEAFFWLLKMLEDTLLYINHHLEDAWGKRDTHSIGGLEDNALNSQEGGQ